MEAGGEAHNLTGGCGTCIVWVNASCSNKQLFIHSKDLWLAGIKPALSVLRKVLQDNTKSG